jgi:AcrR family transcriptional regulator
VHDPDLTARARIRNAALELHARQGADHTTVRQVAELAGVTHGLVRHHFGNKAGLRHAVVDHILERLNEVIEDVPVSGSAAEIGRARNASVNRLFSEHPVWNDYLRREAVDADGDSELIAALTDNTVRGIRELRSAGVTLKTADDRVLVFSIMLREIGPRVLAPLVDQVWRRLVGDDEGAGPAPDIYVWTKRDTTAAPTPQSADGPVH